MWLPGIRGYSDTFSSLVRFGPNKAIVHIDIDQIRKLKNGSIEYFSPLRDGGMLALVKTVAKYDKYKGSPTAPKRYADAFAVTFDPSGKLSSMVRLRIPPAAGKVTAVARLKNSWLTAGYAHSTSIEDAIEMQAHLFDAGGNFIKQIVLPENRNKFSRTGTAGSRAVFRPTALATMNGDVLVFRGFSSQLLYRFSETGELLKTEKLRPDGVDFWSPHLVGDSLFFYVDLPPDKIADLGGIPLIRKRSAFPVFDLKTGKITEILTWTDQGAVGCFNGSRLLIIQEDDSGTWRIRTLERMMPKNTSPKS
jgi:hypothetical protein